MSLHAVHETAERGVGAQSFLLAGVGGRGRAGGVRAGLWVGV